MPDQNTPSITLLLDIHERMAILEQSIKFADMQRQMLIETTTKLNDRLEPFRALIDSVNRLASETKEIKQQVQTHDRVVGQFQLWRPSL